MIEMYRRRLEKGDPENHPKPNPAPKRHIGADGDTFQYLAKACWCLLRLVGRFEHSPQGEAFWSSC